MKISSHFICHDSAGMHNSSQNMNVFHENVLEANNKHASKETKNFDIKLFVYAIRSDYFNLLNLGNAFQHLTIHVVVFPSCSHIQASC